MKIEIEFSISSHSPSFLFTRAVNCGVSYHKPLMWPVHHNKLGFFFFGNIFINSTPVVGWKLMGEFLSTYLISVVRSMPQITFAVNFHSLIAIGNIYLSRYPAINLHGWKYFDRIMTFWGFKFEANFKLLNIMIEANFR